MFNKMSIRAGAVGLASEDGLATYHYEVMRPIDGADGRFLVYLLKSHWMIGELIARERGIGAGDASAAVRTTEVPFTVLRTIEAFQPAPDIQSFVADFLDQETARIDMLIAKQEQLIATLRERLGSVIDRSVYASAETEVAVRRVVSGIRQGWSPNCEPDSVDGVTEWGVLKVGCSNSGSFDPRESKRLPNEEAPRGDLVVRRGEVVMSRSNTSELVGLPAVVDRDYPRLMLSDLNYALMPIDGIDPRYLAYALRTQRTRNRVKAAAKGSSPSMQKLAQRDVLELTVPLSSRATQTKIADYLDAQTAKIDTLIAKAERFIELSKERRAALITAAVTGAMEIPAP